MRCLQLHATPDLHRQGAIQQRMLQMLTGGQSTPPASLAEAAAADVAAAAAQQQSQPQQQLQVGLLGSAGHICGIISSNNQSAITSSVSSLGE